jgi:DNA topoisomerase-1
MDLATIDLDTALRLLSCRASSASTPTGEEITAQNGRYGPYLKKGTDSRTWRARTQLFDVTLEEALAIYAQPKTRGDGRTAKPPLARVRSPTRCRARRSSVKDGRFGPYVTDGETNATLRKGDDPATITPSVAFELFAEKRARGPVTRKRAAAKKTTAKTTAKTAAKKTTAKRTTAPATATKTAAAKKTAARKTTT